MQRPLKQSIARRKSRIEHIRRDQHERIVVGVIPGKAQPVRQLRFKAKFAPIRPRLVRIEKCPRAERAGRRRRKSTRSSRCRGNRCENIHRNPHPIRRQHLIDSRIHRRATLRRANSDSPESTDRFEAICTKVGSLIPTPYDARNRVAPQKSCPNRAHTPRPLAAPRSFQNSHSPPRALPPSPARAARIDTAPRCTRPDYFAGVWRATRLAVLHFVRVAQRHAAARRHVTRLFVQSRPIKSVQRGEIKIRIENRLPNIRVGSHQAIFPVLARARIPRSGSQKNCAD